MSGFEAAFTLRYRNSGAGAAAAGTMREVQRALRDTAGVARQTIATTRTEFARLASARETLGIRSEKVIQNEIRQTERAYRRMADSGVVSSRELARAQEQTTQRVARLRQELEIVNHQASRLPGLLRGAGAGIAAWHAGKAVLAGPVGATMSYDRQLAHLSNTAFSGKSVDDRRAGMRTLDAAIVSSVRSGGGNREGALGSLDRLVASGAFKTADALKELPTLTKYSTASNADPAALADIAIRGRQTFGLTNTSLALDQAMKAGQLGGFELKDMARWLPEQMAEAGRSGMTGDAGFRALLAANQASAITAGSKDAAGNNLANLLGKINSNDTAADAKRLGIDLAGSLAAARAKGTNSLDAFANLAEQIASKDTRYTTLRDKAAGEKGDAQRATYDSMADILQGSSIGKIVQDRQAMMALIGIMNNRQYMNGVRDQLGGAAGTGQAAFDLISTTPSFKAEQLAAEIAIAMQTALDRVNPALGGMADTLTSVMREFPNLSAAIAGATFALTALAAAAGAAAVTSVLTGGGRGGAGRAAAAVFGGAAARAGSVLRWAGRNTGLLASRVLGTAAGTAGAGLTIAGVGGYQAGTLINHGIDSVDRRYGTGMNDAIGELVARLLAALGNRTAQETLETRKIVVEVKNGNIVAALEEAAERKARRN